MEPWEGEIHFVKCLRVPFQSLVVRPHRHNDCHEMILVLAGEMRTEIADRVIVGHCGDLLFYPQGVEHTPKTQTLQTPEIIALRWSGGDKLAKLNVPDIRYDQDGRIRRQLEWMLSLYPSQNRATQQMLQALTYTAIYEFGRLQNPATRDLTARTRTYIRTHLNQRITLDDLATEVNMSKYHFARTFKHATGQTPIGLVNQMKIDTARELLLQTDLSLEAIATQVGLADASHLSHVFRRITGCPPGAFRHNRPSFA